MDIEPNDIKKSVSQPEQADQSLINDAQETSSEATDTTKLIAEQMASAITGYVTTVDQLNFVRRGKDQIPIAEVDDFDNELGEWFTAEKAEAVNAELEADPELRFWLIATPNVIVSPGSIKNTAIIYGENLPVGTRVYGQVYDKYTAIELSGTDPDNRKKFQFGLMPSKFTAGLTGSVEQQRAKLRQLQDTKPYMRVPSALEALTYWNTISPEELQPEERSEIFKKTYIRHFDLEEKPIGGRWYVPCTFFNDDGGPVLFRSEATFANQARLLIG